MTALICEGPREGAPWCYDEADAANEGCEHYGAVELTALDAVCPDCHVRRHDCYNPDAYETEAEFRERVRDAGPAEPEGALRDGRRACPVCLEALPEEAHVLRVYCSDRCRKRHDRQSHCP